MERYVDKKKTEQSLAKGVLGAAGIALAAGIGSVIGHIPDKVEKENRYTEYAEKNPETRKARHLLGEIDSMIKRDGLTIEASKSVRNMITFYLSGSSKEEQGQKLGFLSGELVMNMDHIDVESKRLIQEVVDDFSRTLATEQGE